MQSSDYLICPLPSTVRSVPYGSQIVCVLCPFYFWHYTCVYYCIIQCITRNLDFEFSFHGLLRTYSDDIPLLLPLPPLLTRSTSSRFSTLLVFKSFGHSVHIPHPRPASKWPGSSCALYSTSPHLTITSSCVWIDALCLSCIYTTNAREIISCWMTHPLKATSLLFATSHSNMHLCILSGREGCGGGQQTKRIRSSCNYKWQFEGHE